MSAEPPPAALRFPELDRTIPARHGESVFQAARRHGVRLVGACGGRGACGTCLVRVVKGDAQEIAGGAKPGRSKWVRACQVHACGDCTIEVAPRSLAPVVRSEVEAAGSGEILGDDPAVLCRDLALDQPGPGESASDFERVARALAPLPVDRIDLAAARKLPGLLRDGGWYASARLRGGELIDVAAPGSPVLGLAVDLGTTNAVGFLVDLATGRRVAGLGLENPQAPWGADVVSRINHAARDAAAAAELRDAALRGLGALAHDLARSVGATPQDIVDVAVCGNTAMHHLLLGLPVAQLGRAPFVAAVRDGLDLKARELGLAVAPGAWVHLVPNVGGFVGGDHTAALLAAESHWRSGGASLLLDIGTNTEITVAHDGRLLSASCPSGPALEGGHIACGMRAAEGAIERVRLRDGAIEVRTIGGKDPVGLCGSGVIDAVAALLGGGLVDARGRIAADQPGTGTEDGMRHATLAPGVRLTQADVRAVQLAKAAIRTGIALLLDEAGLAEDRIERFVIAGAFGAYIDVDSAVAIGLFPDLPRSRFVAVGNAAGLGVQRILASVKARERARRLAAECRYLELASRADFQKTFMHHIGFHRENNK